MDLSFIVDWLVDIENWNLALEIGAIIFTTLCIFLAGHNNIHTWWTGFVGCVLFGILFLRVNLYADALLQIFFMYTAVTGYFTWKNVKVNCTQDLPITNVDKKQLLLYLSIGAVVGLEYVLFLSIFTNAYAPIPDTIVLVLSVISQYLLINKKLEAWVGWFIVNIIAVPLFFSRGLEITAILYLFYLFHSMYAFMNWYKIMTNKKSIFS